MPDFINVHVYEPCGYVPTVIEVRVGDRVAYKLDGRRGSSVGVVARIGSGKRDVSVRSDADPSRLFAMHHSRIFRAWRDGGLLGVPAPFVGEVLRFEAPTFDGKHHRQGEVEVSRPGCSRVLFLNSYSPGWPARSLTPGVGVRCEMREAEGYPLPIWFVV